MPNFKDMSIITILELAEQAKLPPLQLESLSKSELVFELEEDFHKAWIEALIEHGVKGYDNFAVCDNEWHTFYYARGRDNLLYRWIDNDHENMHIVAWLGY